MHRIDLLRALCVSVVDMNCELGYMSNSQHFDDELLSAYLDDELAPDERARVDERLASDPASRQLLADLRGVSQAMKGLPAETVGVDLREAVLRRAERAMLVGGSMSPEIDDNGSTWKATLARIPIGRSRRSWFWASVTVAAGLFVMIFDREANKDAEIPENVAVRAPSPASAPRERSHSELEFRAAPEAGIVISDPDKASSKPAAPSVEFKSEGQLSDGSAIVSGREKEAMKLTPQSGAGVAGLAAAPDASAADALESQSEPDVEEGELLVVHVNVRPEALRRRAFDAVLLKNGISFETTADESGSGHESKTEPTGEGAANLRLSFDQPPASASAAPTNAPAQSQREENLDNSQSPARPPLEASEGEDGENVDILLVEAPVSQIVGCMTEIDADRDSYLGIAVDDEPQAAIAAKKLSKDKKLGADWRQYNRGMVPDQKKVQISPDNKFFYPTERGQLVLDRARSMHQESDNKQENSVDLSANTRGSMRSLDEKPTELANQSRAIRVEPQQSQFGFGGKSFAERRAMGRHAQERAFVRDEGKSYFGADRRVAGEQDESMQVLFVLRAEENESPTAPTATE